MSHAAPAGNAADRNVLYGRLALQMGFVRRGGVLVNPVPSSRPRITRFA
jgi:hypothetical protein